MNHNPFNHTPEQQAELDRLGIKLTPFHLPTGTEADQAMAWELLSRYVSDRSFSVDSRRFGGDCIALGRSLAELQWHRPPDLPPAGKTVLCRGESYDAGYHDGYLLAYHFDGEWCTGKQQSTVTVTEWTYLPAPVVAAVQLAGAIL
jgi:hypothetical protein